MTQGAASLSNNNHNNRGANRPAGANRGRGGKSAASPIKYASSPVARSPTSPSDCATKPYVHCPYTSGLTIVSNADVMRDFEEQCKHAQLHSPKVALRQQPATADGGRTHNGRVYGSPVSPLTIVTDSNGAKRNVCRHFLEGTCNRGSACRFYHPGASHRVVTAPRTPTRRPLTPLADLLAQEQSDLAMSSAYASPRTLPPSAFADAQRATPPNSDSGNNSFAVNPTTSVGSFATPVLSPPSRPAPNGMPQIALPRGNVSVNGSVDCSEPGVTSPLQGFPRGSPGSSFSKYPASSPHTTFARAPASPTVRPQQQQQQQQHNSYAQISV